MAGDPKRVASAWLDKEAAGRVTEALVKRKLKGDDFRLDFHDKSKMTRMVDVAPGVSVTENKGTKLVKGRLVPSGPSKYKATAYQGPSHGGAKGRWGSSGDVDLKAAVKWINEHKDEAERQYKKAANPTSG